MHVPELSFLENVNALKSRLGVNRPRRFISLAEPTFDVSLIEVFTALFTGSALVIPPESMTRQPLKLFDYIKTASVDMMMLTPSLFLSLQEVNIKEILIGRTPVTDVVLGGECFPGNILLDSSRKIQLWNIYGTTECSVWATIYKIESDYSASQVPIGTPLGSTLVEIRDKKEDGTGELWIGGPSRVCHLDDEIESPEMRATGDIVKQDQDGCIYYVGRKGLDQIKRNGQRVHLSSIHKAIGTLPCVSACR